MNYLKLLLFLCLFILLPTSYASLIVPMSWVDKTGHGKKVGYIKADDTIYGVLFTPALHGLPAGVHGFVLRTLPFCSNYAKAAGGHLDPLRTYEHKGPFRGDGHLGDLPVLIVSASGKASLPVVAPRLKLAQLTGRSLTIEAMADNYADVPDADGGSGRPIACGIIPYH